MPRTAPKTPEKKSPPKARALGSRVAVVAGPFTGQAGVISAADRTLSPIHYTLECDGGGTLDQMPADRLQDAPPLPA